MTHIIPTKFLIKLIIPNNRYFNNQEKERYKQAHKASCLERNRAKQVNKVAVNNWFIVLDNMGMAAILNIHKNERYADDL